MFEVLSFVEDPDLSFLRSPNICHPGMYIFTFSGIFNCFVFLFAVFVCLMRDFRVLHKLPIVGLNCIDHLVVIWCECFDTVRVELGGFACCWIVVLLRVPVWPKAWSRGTKINFCDPAMFCPMLPNAMLPNVETNVGTNVAQCSPPHVIQYYLQCFTVWYPIYPIQTQKSHFAEL